MRRRYQPDHDESWSDEYQRCLVPGSDIGVRRRDAQRHVSVVGQLHLLQNNGVTTLLSLIGVCTQVSFVSSREGRVAVFVVDVDQLVAVVVSDRTSTSSVVDTNFVVTGCSCNMVTVVINFVLTSFDRSSVVVKIGRASW